MDHIPVLLNEAMAGLKIKKVGVFFDGTLGDGGFATEILKKLQGGTFVGLDVDPQALERSFNKIRSLKNFSKVSRRKEEFLLEDKNLKVFLLQRNFAQIAEIVQEKNLGGIDGIVLDLGFSSFQLEESRRGFSFLKQEDLDMRFDPRLDNRASDIINQLTKEELNEIFRFLGEEPLSRIIADTLVRQRRLKPIIKTQELVEIVKDVYGKKYRYRSKRHPATRVFQALRIAVNDELRNLQQALNSSGKVLNFGGRLDVISFHSLEDRIVKNFFKRSDFKIINKKPIIPSEDEKRQNPRSRSAKLRIGEKIKNGKKKNL